jgi:hypothetical protein
LLIAVMEILGGLDRPFRASRLNEALTLFEMTNQSIQSRTSRPRAVKRKFEGGIRCFGSI